MVTELIQHDLTAENIKSELKLIENSNLEGHKKMKGFYLELEEKLGSGGASKRVADLIANNLNA